MSLMAVECPYKKALGKVLEAEGVANEQGDVDDIELGKLRAEPSFNRAQHLLWIKQNGFYSEALEDWERQTKSLGERLDRREKRSDELTNQIYNLVGFFSVFQGVILTAVTQLSQAVGNPGPGCPSRPPLCDKVWFPVILSALAGVVAVVGIYLKFRDLHSIDKLIHTEKLDQRAAKTKEEKLIRLGDSFKFQTLSTREDEGFKAEDGQEPNVVPHIKLKSYWILKGFAVILTVVVFAVLFIFSYLVILCDKFTWRWFD